MDAKGKRAEIRARPKQPTKQEVLDIEAAYHNNLNAQDRLDYLRKFRDKTGKEENLKCFGKLAPVKDNCGLLIKGPSRCQLSVICEKTHDDVEKTKALIHFERRTVKAETQLAEQHQLEKIWTKEEILSRVARRDDWACGALMAVYKNQTADEKTGEYTKEHNRVGFTKFDAELMTSFAKQYESKKRLSIKQLAIVRKRIPKYWRQLVKAANEGM